MKINGVSYCPQFAYGHQFGNTNVQDYYDSCAGTEQPSESVTLYSFWLGVEADEDY